MVIRSRKMPMTDTVCELCCSGHCFRHFHIVWMNGFL